MHWSVDGTLVRANASLKSLAPIEVYKSPEQYREPISGKKKAIEKPKINDDDKGNPSVGWHKEKRSNKTAAVPSYVVTGATENRNRS
jgi:hypothetical protein